MKYFKIALVFLLIWSGSAQAFLPHGSIPPSGANSGAQSNIGTQELNTPANFVNMLKMGNVLFNGGATPATAAMDANGYPTQSFTGTIGDTFGNGGTWCSSTVSCTFIWTTTTKLAVINGGINLNCTLTGTGGSVSNCTGGSNVTLSVNQTCPCGAGSMTFNPTGGISLQFPGTATYASAGQSSLALVRTSDVANYTTYLGTNDARGIFTPEFLAVMSGLNLKTIRTMGWVDTYPASLSTEVKWSTTCGSYRTSPTSLNWFSQQFPPCAYGGNITGTDIYTAPPASDTPLGGWVANEVLQGNIANAPTQISISGAVNNGSGLCRLTVSSTTTLATNQSIWITSINGATSCNGVFPITVIDASCSSGSCRIDLQGSTFGGAYSSSFAVLGTQTLAVTGKSGGAVFIASTSGLPIGQNFDSMPAGFATFSYDAILNRAIYSNGGITPSIPIEVQASLANYLHANLWVGIPAMAEDAYVTSWATAAQSSLNTALYLMPEYSNEVWNGGEPQTSWAYQRGLALGFPNNNSRPSFGWYALRVRQIDGNLIPSVWSGSNLRRFLGQPPIVTSSVSAIETYRMNGADLAPSGTGTGTGNALYSSYTGSANYTTKPNRPVDVIESMGNAPYTAGTNFSDQGTNGGTIASSLNASFLQTLATAFDANPNDPTSLASLDADQRGLLPVAAQTYNSGTSPSFSCPTGTTFTTSSAHGFSNTASSLMPAVFSATGGTVCSGLTSGIGYCFINVASTTFQIAAITSSGTCGSTPISVSPGTGVTSVGPINFSSLLGLLSMTYPAWESIAATYDTDRPSGMASIRVEWYEGSSQPVVPTVATLTSLGVTVGGSATTAFNDLTAGLIAWKNSSHAAPFVNTYFSQFVNPALFPHSRTPANLVIPGGYSASNPYPLISGPLPNSTPYQTYNGVANFVGVP